MAPVCPFRALTGLPCPFCGLTRSLVCVAHGRFHEAAAYHPLGPALFVAILVAVAWSLVGLVRSQRALVLPAKLRRYATWAAVAVVLIAWLGRLAGLDPLPN